MICTTYRDAEREARYVAELRAQRVAAVLLAGSSYTDPEVEEPLARELLAFRAAGGRVALIGRHHVALDSAACLWGCPDGGKSTPDLTHCRSRSSAVPSSSPAPG